MRVPALASLVLAACTQDFGLQKSGAPIGGAGDPADTADTGAPVEEPGEDSADPAEDTAAPVEEDDSAAIDTGEPAEDSDPPAEDDCDHSSDLIYVLGKDDARLALFDPESLAFTTLGTLDCTDWGLPQSMGVGRDGVAYVRYSDQSVYAVDLETLRCTATSYSDRDTDFGAFGMGFATNSADTWRDRLYVANEEWLATLDTDTYELSRLGRLSSQAELSGNADGELWALLPLESPAELLRLDKADGATLERIALPRMPDSRDIDTFAFATWGGEFWLFIREFGMGNSTTVYRVDAEGDMTTALEDIGWDIVGAGVSTCAPTE